MTDYGQGRATVPGRREVTHPFLFSPHPPRRSRTTALPFTGAATAPLLHPPQHLLRFMTLVLRGAFLLVVTLSISAFS